MRERALSSPGSAIGWEFGRRHRWGFAALLLYFIVLAAYKLLFEQSAPVVDLSDASPDISEQFAFTVIVPMTCGFFYILAVFSYGLSSDVAARESMYPARMFTLPVSTAALAGWPMLYGIASMVVLWVATAILGLVPSGLDVPLLWPALFMAAFIAWTQALMWMPYGLRGIRIVIAVLLMTTIDTAVILAITYDVDESAMIAILAPLLPLAYLTAAYALARSRRGDIPDWTGVFSRWSLHLDVLPRRRSFPSSYAAQAWLEWRQSGATLPVWVALLVSCELGLLFFANADSHKFVLYTLVAVMLSPPVLAAFAAAAMSKSNPEARESYDVAPFFAVRPMTTAAFIGAKLRMAWWSTTAAWLFIAAAIPVALLVTGTWPIMSEVVDGAVERTGPVRALAITVLLIGGLFITTWRQLTQTFYIGLTGRVWAVRLHLAVLFALLFCILPVIQWIGGRNDVVGFLWERLDWILAVLVAIKMTAAVWVLVRLDAKRLIGARAMIGGAAVWCAIVLSAYAVMVWIVSTPLIPHYLLALIAVLFVPLARVSASPLALDWNRHR